jgi:CoA-transferase family III
MIPEALLDAIADAARAMPWLDIEPRALLQRDLALSPPGLWSPNGSCHLVEAADGWLAVNLARVDDREAVPAWLQCDVGEEFWAAIVNEARKRTAAELLEQGVLLGLPIALVGEKTSDPARPVRNSPALAKPQKQFSVIDLSALWAGPLCGGLLAEAGMAVTKIESPGRPDPTRTATPHHHKRLNGRKSHRTMALSDPTLVDAIASADILITSARAHALARLGLTLDALFERNPALIWVAITAYGFEGAGAMRVGFGDDTAAAGGLVGYQAGQPRFLGDALADPLTGLRAARLALEHAGNGQSGLIDISLAGTARDFAFKAGLQ